METWTQSLDLEALVRQYGSPLYITHLGQLRRNLAHFAGLVGDAGRVAYPVKANPSFEVLRELAGLGASADCASPHEVDLALASGFPVERLVYNSPAPDRELMARLLASGATVVADSACILEDLAQKLEPRDCVGRLLARVNPAQPVEYLHRTDWKDLVAHASTSSKFGIPSEDLAAVLARCGLPVTGLHLHVGTQMDNTAAFINGLELLHELKDAIERSTGHRLGTLNLGGGLGIGFQAGQSFPSLPDYAAALRGRFRPDLHYMVEPGHALVGDAVALLARIRELKESRGRRWAILDVGSDQLIKVTLLSWRHQILDRRHRALPVEGPDAIGGPHCFAGDVLLPATNLEGQRPGDPLLIQHAGAYCFAVSNHFNGYLGPAHITVNDAGDTRLAYRPEDEFSDHTLLGHEWLSDRAVATPGQPVDLEHVARLSSQYLKTDAAKDTYTFLDVRVVAPRTMDFVVDAQSPLGAISMPFAMRIASDATIVAALYLSGKGSKDVSVWGTRSFIASDAIIRATGPLTLRVHLTPEARLAGTRRVFMVAHWAVNQGKFRGAFRLTF